MDVTNRRLKISQTKDFMPKREPISRAQACGIGDSTHIFRSESLVHQSAGPVAARSHWSTVNSNTLPLCRPMVWCVNRRRWQNAA